MSEGTAWYSTAPALPSDWLAALEGSRFQWKPLPLVDRDAPIADPRPIERAASELPLYDGWIAVDAWGAEALLERAGGALPARLLTASVGTAALWLLREFEIEPQIQATTVADLVLQLAPRTGRQQRFLAPSGSALPLDPQAFQGIEVVCPVAYGAQAPSGLAEAIDLSASQDRPQPLLFLDPGSVEAIHRSGFDLSSIVPFALDAHVAERLQNHDLSPRLVSSEPDEILNLVEGR